MDGFTHPALDSTRCACAGHTASSANLSSCCSVCRVSSLIALADLPLLAVVVCSYCGTGAHLLGLDTAPGPQTVLLWLPDLHRPVPGGLRAAFVQVEPNPGEESDANFPRNLHNAAELFLRAGLLPNAQRLHAAVSKLFTLLEQGPDGRTTHTVGRACVCWGCGHVGLPANADSCSERGPTPTGICRQCGGSEQTNFVRDLCPLAGVQGPSAGGCARGQESGAQCGVPLRKRQEGKEVLLCGRCEGVIRPLHALKRNMCVASARTHLGTQ
mmetsp:Transcript_9993/g.25497  ORF Transcript_9993/g.25497 Transcript_9993/m.25497 type:complete len:270 (-) Transcript_9993:1473-2282(-)